MLWWARRPGPSRSSLRTSTASSSPPPPWTVPRLTAQRKASTAARGHFPSTSELAAAVAGDPAELASFDPFFTFFKGGVAAFSGGVRVGAVGVSGLPGEDDDRIARQAIARAGLDLE